MDEWRGEEIRSGCVERAKDEREERDDNKPNSFFVINVSKPSKRPTAMGRYRRINIGPRVSQATMM